ncbi:MAG: hypothetical protein QXY05_00520 [Candidatus Anstonellales archaeon]
MADLFSSSKKSKYEDPYLSLKTTVELLLDRIASCEKRIEAIDEKQELVFRELSRLSEEVDASKRQSASKHDELNGKLKTLGLEYANLKSTILELKRELNEKAKIDDLAEIKNYMSIKKGERE